MSVSVPPHQHPLDWFVIPELKGEPISFVAYTKTGWVCRLCDSDKLSSADIEPHCQTREHQRNHQLLEDRREELRALVFEKEQALTQRYEDQARIDQAHLDQETLLIEAAQKKQAHDDYLTANAPAKLAASERRAALKQPRAPLLRELRVATYQKSPYTNSSKSGRTINIRQLRAQRLAGQQQQESLTSSSTTSPSAQLKLDKEREKEAKRLQVLETTRRHQQQMEEQELLQKEQHQQQELAAAAAEKEEERLRQEKQQQESMMDCFGCMSYSFLEQTKTSFWEQNRFGL